MSKIRIRNFGPIKEGYLENDGWIDIGKVTVFIGNQGSGKSTIAKAISVMTWLEKALVRGDFGSEQTIFTAQQFLGYQNLKNYLRENSSIEYSGKGYDINYVKYNEDPGVFHVKEKETLATYKLPKIMYVPAERNFLSVIKNAFGVKGLPETLFTFGEELRRAQQELKGEPIVLPINNFQYQYEIENDTSYVIGENYKLSLNEASSGLQSTIPLFIVSKNLAEQINAVDDSITVKKIEALAGLVSIDQILRMQKELTNVATNDASASEKLNIVNSIFNRYFSSVFINIVEEPEQNLYPSSQKKILESLLEFNNMNEGNKLIMTTHSPYLINYLTLAVKAGTLKIKAENHNDQLEKINEIVPLVSAINANDLVIYELDEKAGSVKRLETYNGLPSDENELNEMLDEGNDLFAQLLEIEQSL